MAITARVTELIALIGIPAAPLVVWAVLYVLGRRSSLDFHTILPWLNRLQWLSWGTAVGLFLFALAPSNHALFPFACACGTLNAGFSIAQSGLKRRFAPDLIESTNTEGWWPSKRG